MNEIDFKGMDMLRGRYSVLKKSYQFDNGSFRGTFKECLDYLIEKNEEDNIEAMILKDSDLACRYLRLEKPNNIYFKGVLARVMPESLFFSAGLEWLKNNLSYVDAVVLRHIEELLPVDNELMDLLVDNIISQRQSFLEMPTLSKNSKIYCYFKNLSFDFFKKLGKDKELLKNLVTKPLNNAGLPLRNIGTPRVDGDGLALLQSIYLKEHREAGIYILDNYLQELLEINENLLGHPRKSFFLEHILEQARNSGSYEIYKHIEPLANYFSILEPYQQGLYTACLLASLKFENIDSVFLLRALNVVPYEMLVTTRASYLEEFSPESEQHLENLMCQKKLELSLAEKNGENFSTVQANRKKI